MDILSLGKASKTLREIQQLNNEVVAPLAESRFPTIDARLDWLEGQASKILVENSKQLDLSQGVFDNTELVNGKIQLKLLKQTGAGYSDNLIPIMTSNTAPSGKSSASNINSGSQDAYKAFDGIDSTYWYGSSLGLGWLAYEFSEAKVIQKYRITANTSSVASVSPKNWTFEGSNDGINWLTLDTQNDITFTVNNEQKEFVFANATAFKIYRINITATGGGSRPAIAQLEMMESAVQNQYSPEGTYESPIIDLGEGWKETKLVDAVKQVSAAATPTTSIEIKIASSLDGVSFSEYALINPAILPQARYVKIRAVLTATEQAGESKTLQYDQASTENTVTLNEFTEAAGDLKLKTSYRYSDNTPAVLGIGFTYEFPIEKSKFKKITGLGVN